MARIPKDMQVGCTHPTKRCGLVEVLEYINSRKVRVKFIATGFITYTMAHNLRNGCVSDPYKPTVQGIGFLGEGSYKSKSGNTMSKVYQVWHDMLRRCYSSEYQEKQPTYIGCSVCPEWLNFQTFGKWFDDNYIPGYHLDKDIKVPGNKVYSPETCLFVSREENMKHRVYRS